jgi:glycolate oxidase iron-sulfur subunit
LACQSACPAGVDYTKLFETARAEVEQRELLSSWTRRFYRWLALRVLFVHPRLLRAVGWSLWLYQRAGLQRLFRSLRLNTLLPSSLRRLEPKMPRIGPPFSDARIAPRETPPRPRYKVALLTGCVQDLVYPDVNRATVDVLLRNDCEVVTPRYQYCCGSLHAHNGDLSTAQLLAKRNLDAFDLGNLDAVITNAGGCGSHLKRYSMLFAGDPYYDPIAKSWDRKVKDIHEWLSEIGFQQPSPNEYQHGVAVTYDDSCHLCHGQQVRSQPRQVLSAIPGIKLLPLTESEWCCGSAGIYGITHPAQAEKLLQRKLDHVATTGATILTTANPGCLLQLSLGAAERQDLAHLQIIHPICLLADAYSREVERSKIEI